MQTATADPLVGRRLEGRYRIIDRIARGGMSTVYEAVDERLDRHVAVKVMSATLSADPAFTDRFSREARAAARLTHLNTVAVYDQGTDTSGGANHVFLVMELVQGRTLRALIREREGRFTPAEALSIMQPVLAALSAAHAAGIVHRDVKPENILLSDDGIVKVADFGLARAVEADAQTTRTGLMMGTVAYCAPEQISRGHADQRSDVYACGIVLFELLTGTPPFQGESAMNVAYQHVHGRVPAPSSRTRGIPSEIDELVINATDPDPAMRQQDAGEFLAEIADTRARLRLPLAPIPPRPRSARRAVAAPNSDFATTDLLGNGRAVDHDTRVVGRPVEPPPRREAGPLPPVVIPPPRRKQRTVAQRRRRRGLIALLVVILLGVAVAVGAWWYASGRYSTIPRLRGELRAAATADLTHAGFKVGAVSSDWSETVPKNEVIDTSPGGGTRLIRGRSVSIILSLGAHRLTVPAVAGKPLADAQSQFSTLGLKSTATEVSDDTTPKGDVVRTDPAAGTQVKPDVVVTIYVSTGPPIVNVPQIAQGTPYDQAAQELIAVNLVPKRVDTYSDTVAAGDVISVDPANQQVKFGTVTLTVSKGPEFVTIPDIPNGTSYDSAAAQLKQLGLVVHEKKHFGGFLGEVVGMDPQAGTRVQVGSVVTLDVV